MTVVSEVQILADLTAMLRDFEGREYSGPIGAETWFFADMGFASIDAVVLAETLSEKYALSIPLHQLMAKAAESGKEDLTLGELASLIHAELCRQ